MTRILTLTLTLNLTLTLTFPGDRAQRPQAGESVRELVLTLALALTKQESQYVSKY